MNWIMSQVNPLYDSDVRLHVTGISSKYLYKRKLSKFLTLKTKQIGKQTQTNKTNPPTNQKTNLLIYAYKPKQSMFSSQNKNATLQVRLLPLIFVPKGHVKNKGSFPLILPALIAVSRKNIKEETRDQWREKFTDNFAPVSALEL